MNDLLNFSSQFQVHFQSVFWQSVRELRDETVRPSLQTVAILRMLSHAGPATVGELSQRLERAQSTISEIVERLMVKDLVDKMPDAGDARRSLIWLTRSGHDVLQSATTPLDPARLDALAKNLTLEERTEFLLLFQKLAGGPND